MSRFLIQSTVTGKFLCPDLQGGEPCWVACLRDAGGGVFSDGELIHQLIQDNTDYDDRAVVVDLDRLGSMNDYPVNF